MQYLGFVYLRFRFNLTSCFYLETLSVIKHVGSGEETQVACSVKQQIKVDTTNFFTLILLVV